MTRRPRAVILLLAACVCSRAAASPAGMLLRVGPGDPGGLEAARDRVRESLRRHRQPVTILLAAGTYELSRTLVLTVSDSGTASAPVTWKAAPGGRVRITGGREISGWSAATDQAVLGRLLPAVRPLVRVTDLPAQGVRDFGTLRRRGFGLEPEVSGLELVCADRMMTLARHPNDGWLTVSATLTGDAGVERFAFLDPGVTGWARASGAWVHGYWTFDWADTHDPVVAFDPARGEAAIRTPADWYGVTTGARFRFEDALEALDAPGEWWLDRAAGRLYFLPPGGTEPVRTVVTLLEGPLITLAGASHVRLEGLILEDGRGDGVRVTDGADCRVTGCVIRNLGGLGVRIRGGRDHRVRSCDVYGTGEGAVALAGGDRATLTPCGHAAENNDLHDYARWSRTYRPGVLVEGVGCRVAHNWIHDAPHNAILLGGNDHLIELNLIERVCLETGDTGAFYTGRDPTARGTVIRHNIFRNLSQTQARPGEVNEVMAVYLDDCACGTRVEGNLFDHAGWAVMIGGGRDNEVAGNVFIGCDPAVSVDARALGWAKELYRPGGGWEMAAKLEAVPLRSARWRERYPALRGYSLATSGSPTGNRITGNVCAGGRWLQLQDGLTGRIVTIRNNVVEGAAGSRHPSWPDIPLGEIGLVPDGFRKALP